ncbi:hypothetical protein [Marilutibacter chinensis]|uniref:Uncharacterized protein n=1 Tax=Marilutibacter chinensis TaxID=2912247 RepID=A0ABS9HRT4_9GAMM|nr:hypothetical protein [Lysobacter chinensis]MCF7221368.1 hypothetical protein [Lysobacter chinensis]
MLPTKTPKAHAALTEHSAKLSVIERRALIISNGRRSLDEIAGMLGAGALAAIDRLLRDGYLVADGTGRSTSGATASVLEGARHAVRSVLASQAPSRSDAPTDAPTRPAVIPPAMQAAALSPSVQAATQPASAAALRTVARRSLAASKMYVIGLLQLLRNADAVALAASLQATRDPDEIVEGMLDALRHIRATCNPSYTQRVGDRLAEILPEKYLPEVRAERAGRPQATT